MNSIYLNPTSPEEIFKVIRTIKPSRSCGPDNISNELLKQINSAICTPISCLINKSLETGTVPTSMKNCESHTCIQIQGQKHIHKLQTNIITTQYIKHSWQNCAHTTLSFPGTPSCNIHQPVWVSTKSHHHRCSQYFLQWHVKVIRQTWLYDWRISGPLQGLWYHWSWYTYKKIIFLWNKRCGLGVVQKLLRK